MPRLATISRDQLTDALMRVVVERGLDAVSIRSVAREAGVSIGAVQYWFPSKDDLLLAAYERAIEQVTTRARVVAECATCPEEYVRLLLHELLPLDERRAAELRVAVAFSARSVYSPRLTTLYTEAYQALIGAVEQALGEAVALGEALPGVEPRRDAIQAVALADGLAWHALCAPSALAVADAAAALDAHLAGLVPRRTSVPSGLREEPVEELLDELP